jgi:hypothetical protein
VDINPDLSFERKDYMAARKGQTGADLWTVATKYGHIALKDTTITVNTVVNIKAILDSFYTDLDKQLL